MTENYVKVFMSRKQRTLLAQLRLGILPLEIETGRFRNVKDAVTGNFRKLREDERICKICEMNQVENEFHFICVCPKYDVQRTEFYQKVGEKTPQFISMNSNEKIVYLLKIEPHLLARFIESIWNIRQNLLYV